MVDSAWRAPANLVQAYAGFSCQAYDVDENRYVACKIHQLVPQWTEEHKRSYVRHAVRPLALVAAERMAFIDTLFFRPESTAS
jgi:hypothetical protein